MSQTPEDRIASLEKQVVRLTAQLAQGGTQVGSNLPKGVKVLPP